MFAEERRGTGRTKERTVNPVWGAGNTNPKLQAKLHIFPPFPHTHLSTGAQTVITIKRVLGHKGGRRQIQLEQDPLFPNGLGSRKNCFLPSMGTECTTVLSGL